MFDISIVIPNYHSGTLLERCITSVQKQSFSNWEVIIVDNDSTDESRMFIEGISDPRVRTFQINNHGVIAKSRNFAAQNANGRYLAFLDADDWWEREKLSSAIQLLDSGRGDLVYHRLRRDPKRILRPYVGGPYSRTDRGLIKYGNRVPNSSVVMRSDDFNEIGRFDESSTLVASEDFDLWERLSRKGVRFIFQDQVLGSYHEAQGTMNSSSRRIHSALSLVEKHQTPYIPGWLRLAEVLLLEESLIPKSLEKARTPLTSYIRTSEFLLHYLLILRRRLIRPKL